MSRLTYIESTDLQGCSTCRGLLRSRNDGVEKACRGLIRRQLTDRNDGVESLACRRNPSLLPHGPARAVAGEGTARRPPCALRPAHHQKTARTLSIQKLRC
jgi:hypothetical protein